MSEDNKLTADEFLDWVEQTADTKEESTENVFDELVSAYWVYTELQRTLDSIENPPVSESTEVAHRDEDPSSSPTPQRDQSDEGTVSNPPPDSSNKNRNETKMESNSSSSELWSRIYDVSRRIETYNKEQTERLIQAETRIDSIERTMQSIENQSIEHTTTTDNSVKESSEFYDELDEVRSELSALESDVQTIQQSYEELRAQVEQEFNSIETAFEKAIDSRENLEAELSDWSERVENDSAMINSLVDDQKRLQEIKKEAMQLGVQDAKCEHCGEQVDISMLAAPECPHCETPFDNISPSGWNPLRSNIMTTAPRDLSTEASQSSLSR